MRAQQAGRIIVVKVGSSTLTDDRGKLRLARIASLVVETGDLQRQGHHMLLVTSGAVSAGMGLLSLPSRPTEMVDLQAASAVGQGHLYHTYSQLFAHEHVVTAQVLLTAFDVSARAQYLNSRNTLNRLLEWGVVPIINENDTTSTDELGIGDNDNLAAQVAILVRADLLVLLTDTDGLFTANPATDSRAEQIREVRDFAALDQVEVDSRGALGSGGMRGKVEAARMATGGGVETVIARGSRAEVIAACVRGDDVGTRFFGRDLGLGAYKLWLLHGQPAKGRVTVDEGAAKALRGKGSLLPVGITAVEGAFAAGDVVLVVDGRGRELAKGVVSYSWDELELVKGLRSGQVVEKLANATPEAIHRDYLVLVE